MKIAKSKQLKIYTTAYNVDAIINVGIRLKVDKFGAELHPSEKHWHT